MFRHEKDDSHPWPYCCEDRFFFFILLRLENGRSFGTLVLLGKVLQTCRFEGTYLSLLFAYIFVKFIHVFLKFNIRLRPPLDNSLLQWGNPAGSL